MKNSFAIWTHKTVNCMTRGGSQEHEAPDSLRKRYQKQTNERKEPTFLFCSLNAMVTMDEVNESKEVPCILDSGASDHFCGDRNLFTTFHDIEPFRVNQATSETAAVGVGTVKLSNQIGLENCYFILGLKGVLFSVYCIEAIKRGTIVFKVNQCSVFSSSGQKLLSATGKDGIYVFYTGFKQAMIVNITSHDDYILWHNRLNHHSMTKLKETQKLSEGMQGNLTGKSAQKHRDLCHPCINSKMKRMPMHSKSLRKLKRVGELVSSDICIFGKYSIQKFLHLWFISMHILGWHLLFQLRTSTFWK